MSATRTLVALVALAITASACSDNNGTLDDRVIVVENEGTTRGNAAADVAANELAGSQGAVVIGKTATILRVLNDNEIAKASFAIDVVNTNAVANFAAVIVDDHTAANAMLDVVVRGYGVAFIPSTTAAQLAQEGSAALADLRSTPPTDVDFEFTQLMVMEHAEALVVLDELAAQVGPGAMGDFIASSRVMVQDHLDQAEALLDTFF
jgi:predicted outer membrane protein